MDEALELDVAAALGDEGDLVEREFARQHDAAEAEVSERQDAFEVVGDKLRRSVERQVGEVAAADSRDAEVLHDQRVGAERVETRQRVDGVVEGPLVDERVEGDVDAPAPGVGVAQQSSEVVRRQVVRKGARGERGETAVDGVGARLERGERRLEVSGRSEQFDASHERAQSPEKSSVAK